MTSSSLKEWYNKWKRFIKETAPNKRCIKYFQSKYINFLWENINFSLIWYYSMCILKFWYSRNQSQARGFCHFVYYLEFKLGASVITVQAQRSKFLFFSSGNNIMENMNAQRKTYVGNGSSWKAELSGLWVQGLLGFHNKTLSKDKIIK